MLPLALYLLLVPALLVLFLSAVVRANDIGSKPHALLDTHPHGKWFWACRRLGLVMVAGASIGWLLEPLWFLTGMCSGMAYFCGGVMLWGFALDWLTSIGLPPWWRHITGYFERTHPNWPFDNRDADHARTR